jgi:hypothetical protein
MDLSATVKQGASCPQPYGEDHHKPSLGAGSAGLKPSGKGNPCPICGRTKDGDCRIGAELVLCHYGSSHHPPEGLRPGDTHPGGDGQQWAYTKGTSDGRAATFVIDRPLQAVGAPPRRIEVAQLPEARPEPPSHLPNGQRLKYSDTQAVVLVVAGDSKKHIPHHTNASGKEVRGAGAEPWPLWRQADAIKYGAGKWIIETEGEKCAAWPRAAGLVAVSQPGHDTKEDSITGRYKALRAAGVAGVAYLADNDKTGAAKGAKCQRAAAAAGLPFLLLQAAEVWPDVCIGGSIDDAPGSAQERAQVLQKAIQKTATTKTAKTVNSSRPGAAAPTPPASVAGFIHQLPDGWVVDEETGVKRRSGLSVGHFADLLEAQPPHLRFNEMTMFVEVETTSGWVAMRDADMNSTYVLLSQKGWVIGIDPITKAICHVAQQQSFHPVRQYLLGLEQDAGTAAFDLDEVAPRFFRSPDPLHVAMVRKWLIGAVWRAMEPGCQMDYCLVLQSRHQGIGKTTSFKALASADWFNSSAPDGDKDFLLNVHSCWIFEMGELESHTGKRSAGHMKNLITITTDNFRAPYGRNNEPHRRGSVFCGTVNEESFLRDETGNRRYWVVPIAGTEPLARDGLLAARDGIWKAAVAAYRANELPMLTRAQEALSEIQNETFTYSDPWLEMLQNAIESNPPRWQMPFSTAEALAVAGLKNSEQITRADENRLAPVLRQLGFDKAKHPATTGDGKRIRLWSTAQPAQPLHNLNGGGCAPPEPLRQKPSQRTAQPAQPISSKKSKMGDEQAAAAAAASLNVETGCAGCAPPPNPLCRNGSDPAQPPRNEVVQVVQVVHPSTRQEDERRILELRPAAAIADWPDDEVAELRQSLEQAAKRRASGFAIPVQEVA